MSDNSKRVTKFFVKPPAVPEAEKNVTVVLSDKDGEFCSDFSKRRN